MFPFWWTVDILGRFQPVLNTVYDDQPPSSGFTWKSFFLVQNLSEAFAFFALSMQTPVLFRWDYSSLNISHRETC